MWLCQLLVKGEITLGTWEAEAWLSLSLRTALSTYFLNSWDYIVKLCFKQKPPKPIIEGQINALDWHSVFISKEIQN